MLQIKNKSLGKLLRNKYFYYVVVALSVLNVLKYLNTGNVYCLLSFVGITVLSNKFLTKNMTFSLLLALFVASFFLGCGKIIEGYEGDTSMAGKADTREEDEGKSGGEVADFRSVEVEEDATQAEGGTDDLIEGDAARANKDRVLQEQKNIGESGEYNGQQISTAVANRLKNSDEVLLAGRRHDRDRFEEHDFLQQHTDQGQHGNVDANERAGEYSDQGDLYDGYRWRAKTTKSDNDFGTDSVNERGNSGELTAGADTATNHGSIHGGSQDHGGAGLGRGFLPY